MLSNLLKYNIVLASNSPRRKQLLSGLDVEYTVIKLSGVDESYPLSLKAGQIPDYIAHEKANAYKPYIKENDLIITADTIVWLGDKALGKPRNADEANVMLHHLSGQTHQVYTGVCLTTNSFQRSFVSVSDVTFARLTDEEIDYYVAKYNPLDKAGAYGVQEWLGYIGVENIKGSFYNVMGLPTQQLYKELKKI